MTILGKHFVFFKQYYLTFRLSRHEATVRSQNPNEINCRCFNNKLHLRTPFALFQLQHVAPSHTPPLQHVVSSMEKLKSACIMTEMSTFFACAFVCCCCLCLCLCLFAFVEIWCSLFLTHVVGAARKHLEFWRLPLRVPLPAAS